MPQTLAKGVLFACNMNSIRSPMAEVIARDLLPNRLAIDSVGVYVGEADPFVPSILAESGLELGEYTPKSFKEVDLATFDLIVALTREAETEARRFTDKTPVVFWDTPNPTDVMGRRDQLMDAYRAARDTLFTKIKAELR